jgi:hypothetical protein
MNESTLQQQQVSTLLDVEPFGIILFFIVFNFNLIFSQNKFSKREIIIFCNFFPSLKVLRNFWNFSFTLFFPKQCEKCVSILHIFYIQNLSIIYNFLQNIFFKSAFPFSSKCQLCLQKLARSGSAGWGVRPEAEVQPARWPVRVNALPVKKVEKKRRSEKCWSDQNYSKNIN